MNKVISEILQSMLSKERKKEELKKLSDDIQTAKDVLDGKLVYCPDCDDYYLSGSFQAKHETKPWKICTYSDPINSGGNEYEDGFLDITYHVCPKGHKHCVSRKERLKDK